MKRTSLVGRFIYSTLIAFAITCVICGVAGLWLASRWIDGQTMHQARDRSDEIVGRIAVINQLERQQVEGAMHVLKEVGGQKGAPALQGKADLAGKTVPDLRFGNESQVLQFSVVDHVKQLQGGTATLFAWDGHDFVRISTSVMKPDGTRAAGTVLDPRGKAFAALSHGQPFEGVVDILGVPYVTEYEPMNDIRGNLVGAWYAGYRLDSIESLGKTIEGATILDHGFVALLKPSGKVVFHGRQATDAEMDAIAAGKRGWVTMRTTDPAWGYTVLSAYPLSDVWKLEAGLLAFPEIGTLSLMIAIIVLQLVLLRRLVLGPVSCLTETLSAADLNTLLDSSHHDEIGALASSFNRYVMRLRETLFKVRDGSAEATGKSDEIRGISEITVEQLFKQRQSADEAARAIEELSHDIADISTHTQDASTQSRTAAEAARRGAQLVSTSVALMQRLSKDTQKSAGRIQKLTERAEEIGSIVNVIDEIAAGTNLLALNASIEAARAGEHGRGFAVVAGEVRRLAERTAQATQQVAGLVAGVKNETAEAAGDIRTACNSALEGASTVSSLSSTFDHITAVIIEVDGQVEKIAIAARQVANAAEGVRKTMNDVAASSEKNADRAVQVVAASGKLLETASSLESMVDTFDLHELPEDRAA
jgi:methyl-accepting chemotaxis protein